MAIRRYSSSTQNQTKPKGQNRPEVLERIAADARKQTDTRMQGYREQSLRLHPWVCARCGRAFTRENLIELTVHHKNHNHDDNPPDGSNWENLCIFCHDNEHARYVEHLAREDQAGSNNQELPDTARHNPFANLASLLGQQRQDGKK
ncbi:MAG: HNH nuclease family protein [Magnetococcales bacterium]|nr:HNH nuclease family protein [Magnetococcales bacterium]